MNSDRAVNALLRSASGQNISLFKLFVVVLAILGVFGGKKILQSQVLRTTNCSKQNVSDLRKAKYELVASTKMVSLKRKNVARMW